MKYLLCLLVIFLFSCSPKEESTYIVKYGNKEVSSVDFINKLMVLGFTKYGKPFYTKVYDKTFFDNLRSETLEHIVSSMFYSSLSQKYQIKITDAELEAWIRSRTPDLNREDLVYMLKANNLSYTNWKALFREQLIQNRIVSILEGEPSTKTDAKKKKKSNDDALYMAVITFDDAMKAKDVHKRISRNRINYADVLKQESNTSSYSWIRTKDVPFYEKIRHLSNRRVSKPIETPWGHILVQIKKRGKYPLPSKNTATSHRGSAVKLLLEEFKKNPKLQINTDLLYSLKIKK